jgi:hypothetical protein
MKKKNKEIQSWFWNLSYIDMATSFVYSGICWTGWWLKLVCYYVCLQDFSASWEIKATPTFFFLRDGQQVDKLVGANKPELHKKITAILDSLPPSAKWLLWWFLVSVRAYWTLSCRCFWVLKPFNCVVLPVYFVLSCRYDQFDASILLLIFRQNEKFHKWILLEFDVFSFGFCFRRLCWWNKAVKHFGRSLCIIIFN